MTVLNELKGILDKLNSTKKSIDAVTELLRSGRFNSEDAIKVLERISDEI